MHQIIMSSCPFCGLMPKQEYEGVDYWVHPISNDEVKCPLSNRGYGAKYWNKRPDLKMFLYGTNYDEYNTKIS